MDLDVIREKVADEICNAYTIWGEKLNDTMPGHYGADGIEIQLDMENVYVDVPNRSFTFTNAQFDFDLRLGATNDGGFDESFSKTAAGSGTFEFSDSNKEIEIRDLNIDVDLDLYAEDE